MSIMWKRTAYDPEAARARRARSKELKREREALAARVATLVDALKRTEWRRHDGETFRFSDDAYNDEVEHLEMFARLDVGEGIDIGECTFTRIA